MRSMGLDFGERRIGVALSDPGGVLASPFTIIECTNEERDIEAIHNIIAQHEVGQIVVGLPLKMDGSIGEQAAKVESFVDKLRVRTGIPVCLTDERLSTVSARRLVQAGNRKTKKTKTRYDAAAAAVILQSYLEEQMYFQ